MVEIASSYRSTTNPKQTEQKASVQGEETRACLFSISQWRKKMFSTPDINWVYASSYSLASER
jgi:hypothetical protein